MHKTRRAWSKQLEKLFAWMWLLNSAYGLYLRTGDLIHDLKLNIVAILIVHIWGIVITCRIIKYQQIERKLEILLQITVLIILSNWISQDWLLIHNSLTFFKNQQMLIVFVVTYILYMWL